MSSPSLDLIGLVTANLEESLRFYGIVGLPVPSERDDHVECTLPNGLRIAWDSLELIQSIDPDWVPAVGQRIGLAFRCESPTQVDEKHAEVVAAGFSSHREPWDAFWGQRYAQVKDPDGNIIDLFAPLA